MFKNPKMAKECNMEKECNMATECSYCTTSFEKSTQTYKVACPCFKVCYCDKQCQSLHWKSGHKEECQAKAKAKAKTQNTLSCSRSADESGCSGSGLGKTKTNQNKPSERQSQADKQKSKAVTTEEQGQSTSSLKEVIFKVRQKKDKPKKLDSKKKPGAPTDKVSFKVRQKKDKPKKLDSNKKPGAPTDKVWLNAGQKKEKLLKKKKVCDNVRKRGQDGQYESTNEEVLRTTKSKDNFKSFDKAKGALQDIIDRNLEFNMGEWAFRIDCQKEGKYARATSHCWQSTNYKKMIGLEKTEVLDADSSDEDEVATRHKRVCIHCRKEITGAQWSYIKCKAQKCLKRMAHFSCLGFPDITKDLSTAMKKEYYCVGCYEAKENEELEEGDFADEGSRKRKRKTKKKNTSVDEGDESTAKKSKQSRNRGHDTENHSSSVESDNDKESTSNSQRSLASKEGSSSEDSSDVDDDDGIETLKMDDQPLHESDYEPSHLGHASQEKEVRASVKDKNRRLSRSKTRTDDSDDDFQK